MDFTAKQLEPGYEKAIVGIDLRCKEGTLGFDVERDVPADHPPSEYFAAGDYVLRRCRFESVRGKKIPALLNASVWKRTIKDECLPESMDIWNYVNMFDLICKTVEGAALTNDMPMPRSDWLDMAKRSGAVIAAFDLPARFIEWCEATRPNSTGENVLEKCMSYDSVSSNECWKFLGYDIVDDRVANDSAMYTRQIEKRHYEYVFTRQSLRLNSYGILQTEADAIAAAAAFEDIMWPPLSPCGVWRYEGE